MLGKRVRDARKQKGLKQIDLAKRTGLANSTICDIEKGRTNPSLNSLVKIAEVLELPVGFFMPTIYVNNVNPIGTEVDD